MASISIIDITRTDAPPDGTPQFVVQAQIVSDQAGDSTVYADYTGENALHFPQALGSLSDSDLLPLIEAAVEAYLQSQIGQYP